MEKYLMYLLLSILTIAGISCHKDEGCSGIACLQGEWLWRESIGGDIGETLTPANTMSTRTLRLFDKTYREYINGSLSVEKSYEVIVTTDFFGEVNTSIEFENGSRLLVHHVDETRLELIEQCLHCYTHIYGK